MKNNAITILTWQDNHKEVAEYSNIFVIVDPEGNYLTKSWIIPIEHKERLVASLVSSGRVGNIGRRR